MKGETALRRRLRELIEESLSLPYTATGKEGIVTGNPYQTVDLLGETVRGFRKGRSVIFDCFDFKNKTVLDIGSNLGELSRNAHRAGAKRVVGIEYDAYFRLISDLISLHNSLDPNEVTFVQADVTNEYEFHDEFDIVLAFSVFTYMGHRIKEIAARNKELMILETHNIDAKWRDHYVSPLLEGYETLIVFGESDWGATKEFSGGKRLLIACFKTSWLAWQFVLRLQNTICEPANIFPVNLANSSIPALRRLIEFVNQNDLDDICSPDQKNGVSDVLGVSPPSSLSDLSYWLEFYRGYLEYKAGDGEVQPSNSYMKMLENLIATRPDYDPGFVRRAKGDPKYLQQSVKSRFSNFEHIERGAKEGLGAVQTLSPVVCFDCESESHIINLAVKDGGSMDCSRIDGYHRLASAVIVGARYYPAYVFKTFGKL